MSTDCTASSIDTLTVSECIATEGRGNVVSDVVACVLDCFGITDVVSKCHGSRNPYTVIPATFNALSKHETAEEFAMKTGHSLAEVSMLAKMRQL